MQGVITNVQEGYLFMNISKEKIERVNYENYSCCPYIDGFKGICRFNETIEIVRSYCKYKLFERKTNNKCQSIIIFLMQLY